ncbi:MAG TPA: stage V sporulation protein AE [Bacillales bacterium]|nr:stage V sporulation protein AE [Bacillales bacterium]
MKKNVIFVTDGDKYAEKAVRYVAGEIGGRCISQSAGNPTPLAGGEIVSLVKQTPHDPVFIMADDCGYRGEGPGEKAMKEIAGHPDVHVMGAIAVASHTEFTEWTRVDVSVDRSGELTEHGVDKHGVADIEVGRLDGDTVYILDELHLPIVVGVGDIGKMDGQDTVEKGCPITRKAVDLVLERSGNKRA